MKKAIFILGFICLFSLGSNTVQAQRTNFGIRGGVNIATMTNMSDYNMLVEFSVGLYKDIGLGIDKVTFSPELLYSRIGAKVPMYVGREIYDTNFKLDYIRIPLLLKYHFINNSTITPSILLGPYVGFNIRAKAVAMYEDLSLDYRPIVKTMDFGVTFGGEVAIDRFNLGVRYGFGIIDVLKGEVSEKNRVLSVVAGIGF